VVKSFPQFSRLFASILFAVIGGEVLWREVFLFAKDCFSFGQRAPFGLLLRLLARKYVKLPLHCRFASAVIPDKKRAFFNRKTVN
jgi:hypothetical protein